MTAIGVGMIAAEGGDLHAIHQHHAELGAHQLSPGKELKQLVRPSIGCDIIVLRFASQDQIAHTTADQPRLETA